jgi:hypothetical protein
MGSRRSLIRQLRQLDPQILSVDRFCRTLQTLAPISASASPIDTADRNRLPRSSTGSWDCALKRAPEQRFRHASTQFRTGP